MKKEILTGNHCGMPLDPRSKIFLLITLSVFILGGGGSILPVPLYLLLGITPFILLYTAGRWQKASIFLIIYVAMICADYLVLPYHNGRGYILLSVLCQIAVRFMPCLLLGIYSVSTTTVSEFIAGMEKMHITEKLTIPMSVMFRLFPTIGEEFSDIGDAMKLRGIRLGKSSPEELVECRLVPLMICSVNIGEELSASALTRGLTATGKRTNICRIGFRLQDCVVLGLCTISFIWGIVSIICQLLN